MKKLQFWSIVNDQTTGPKSIQREISAFEKETKIKVECTEFPWGKAWYYLINSIKEDNKPDVVQIGNSWVSTLAEIGFLDDITDILYNKKTQEQFYHISPEIGKRYFAFPWILDIGLLFVRKNELTSNYVIDTFDDLLTLCKKSKSKSLFAMGGTHENILIQYMSNFIWGFDGKYVRKNSIDLLDENNFQGIKAFFDLIDRYGMKKMLLDIYGHIMWDFFLKGKGLFTLTNAWVINAFIKEHKKKNEFMAMVIPGNEKKAPYMGGSCLGMVKGTKKMKESISLVNFLTSFQSQKRYLTATGQLPARKDVMHQIIDNYVYKEAILKSLKVARIYPAVPYWGSFENILLEFINLILSMIANNIYNEKHLRDEVQLVNSKIKTVIQLWER